MSNGNDDVDDKELEDFYKSEGAHSVKRLQRQSSRASATSIGSAASLQSGSSSGEAAISRQSSVSSKRMSRQSSTSTSTQEMGIQTTIGRNSSNGVSHKAPAAESKTPDGAKKKERKGSKVKKLFRRKSSTTDGNSNDVAEALPELPQGFIVKYMGRRPTHGLWGSKHTRGPVEEIVDSISKMPKGEDLPLVNLDVFHQGLSMRPHSKNRVKTFRPVQIPIQFISYGLQDTVYPRIFCFIMVKQMSSQVKDMEVHAYACDTAKSSRNLAACLALAFQAYSEKLEGGPFKFAMDIQMNEEDEVDKASCYDA